MAIAAPTTAVDARAQFDFRPPKISAPLASTSRRRSRPFDCTRDVDVQVCGRRFPFFPTASGKWLVVKCSPRVSQSVSNAPRSARQRTRIDSDVPSSSVPTSEPPSSVLIARRRARLPEGISHRKFRLFVKSWCHTCLKPEIRELKIFETGLPQAGNTGKWQGI